MTNDVDAQVAFDSAASLEYPRAERMPPRPPFHTAADLDEDSAATDWIVRPWVAAGSITEVVGLPKAAGKTTWLLHMVCCALDGRNFLGEATVQTPVVYLTEERTATLRAALARADLLGHRDLTLLQWNAVWGLPWEKIVELAIAECRRQGALMLCVDTVSQFAGLSGDDENKAGEAMKAYKPLQRAAASGIAVIATRHERKGGGAVGQSGRGSNAFAGAVDIVVSIRRPSGNGPASVREVYALSRFDDTPDHCVIELRDGLYVLLEAGETAPSAEQSLLGAIERAGDTGLTIEELVSGTPIHRTAAQRAVDRLRKSGKVNRLGRGVKGDPYRYQYSAAASDPSELAESESTDSRAADGKLGL